MTKMLDDANSYFEVWKPEHAEPTREEKDEDIEVCENSITSGLRGAFAYHFTRTGKKTPMTSPCSELPPDGRHDTHCIKTY